MALWAVALAVMMRVLSYLGSGYLLKFLVAAVGQRLSPVRGTVIFTAASTVGLVAGRWAMLRLPFAGCAAAASTQRGLR